MVVSPLKNLDMHSAGASHHSSVLGRPSEEHLAHGAAPQCWLIQGLTLTISSGDGSCLGAQGQRGRRGLLSWQLELWNPRIRVVHSDVI